jgi:hypothetical protein
MLFAMLETLAHHSPKQRKAFANSVPRAQQYDGEILPPDECGFVRLCPTLSVSWQNPEVTAPRSNVPCYIPLSLCLGGFLFGTRGTQQVSVPRPWPDETGTGCVVFPQGSDCPRNGKQVQARYGCGARKQPVTGFRQLRHHLPRVREGGAFQHHRDVVVVLTCQSGNRPVVFRCSSRRRSLLQQTVYGELGGGNRHHLP